VIIPFSESGMLDTT